ncbi:MAG: FAD-binding oxidoreductase [Acidimicrobiia bacterium]
MIVHDLSATLGDGAVSTDRDDLLAHAQDWWVLGMLRKRRGDELTLPECVVRPRTAGEVAAVLKVATAHRAPVIPFGGGSGVCGAAQAVPGAVVLDTRRFDRIEIDHQALTVKAGAGVIGSKLEAVLNNSSLTLGHFPQSIDISTVGGWLATQSAGQKSNRYGRIDEMVMGLTVVLPDGRVIDLPARPGTAAGPDLTRLFLGSEGIFGVITEATLRVRPMPTRYLSAAFRF